MRGVKEEEVQSGWKVMLRHLQDAQSDLLNFISLGRTRVKLQVQEVWGKQNPQTKGTRGMLENTEVKWSKCIPARISMP